MVKATLDVALNAQSSERLTGLMLASGLLLGLLALLIMIVSGASSVFSPVTRSSLAEAAPYAGIYRLLILMWAVAWITQLVGFGLLARLLYRAGSEQPVIIGLTLIFVATILGVLHATLDMSATQWAAQAAAGSGTMPAGYDVLDAWISNAFRLGYVTYLVGTAAFGWAILHAGVPEPWVGRLAIGWSAFWVISSVASVGAPGIVLIMPAVIGAALLKFPP